MNKIIGNEVSAFIDRECVEVTTDNSGWESLFKNTETNQYWVRTYPDSSLHGGGLPLLTLITETEARDRFNV
ncbi:Imm27 family immunity protein [Thalassomonas haliotis]|uniref:Uncharacterized protein n=1 Tax=Thalassomonas haliotis TaxID=485448 RepID=A0ABY7VAT8_9GAMM|nr:Imm27 family immunity protein [Thalassomonas haliotis]WDE10651.1 hypothetical protein H3N35_20685 [Thalassomonas haliotis]